MPEALTDGDAKWVWNQHFDTEQTDENYEHIEVDTRVRRGFIGAHESFAMVMEVDAASNSNSS